MSTSTVHLQNTLSGASRNVPNSSPLRVIMLAGKGLSDTLEPNEVNANWERVTGFCLGSDGKGYLTAHELALHTRNMSAADEDLVRVAPRSCAGIARKWYVWDDTDKVYHLTTATLAS